MEIYLISDFDSLRKEITNRITGLKEKIGTLKSTEYVNPLREEDGLRPHEFSTLIMIMRNSVMDVGISGWN